MGVQLLDVRDAVRATDRAALSPVAWSPTADALAVVDKGVLWTMRSDGGDRRQIAMPGIVSHPAWAPGGDRLAVVVQPPPAAGVAARRSQIWWTGQDGRSVRRILWDPSPRRVAALGWFPDTLYLFVGLAAPEAEATVEWWRVRIAYPDFLRLTTPPHAALDPILSPGGEWIAYIASDGAAERAYAIRRDGSGLHPLSPSARRISGLAWSPHGDKVAYGVIIDDTRAEVSVAAAAAAGPSGPPARLVATYRPEFPDPGVGLSLVWAPDGAYLAYGTNTGALAGPVWLVRLAPR